MNKAATYKNKLLAFTGVVGDLAHNDFRLVSEKFTIIDAHKLIASSAINYLVVIRNKIPIGIVTKKNILSRELSKVDNSSNTIKSIMSSLVVTVQFEEPVFETLMYMLKTNLKLVLVMQHKKTIGVITIEDWLAIQVNYPVWLIKEINRATSFDELKELRKKSKPIIWDNFIKEGNSVSLTNILTVINDSIGKRIIQLSLEQMQQQGKGVPPVPFAWIGMGSEGRKAQTIRTDQDNGIIFEDVPATDYESVKKWFLEFAKFVVNGLDICGFPLCDGNVMATNPNLCNSISKWKEYFQKIIKKSNPKELLEGSIYFDFRCVYGNNQLTNELWNYLFKCTDKHVFFMRYFAENMLEASRPPIKKWQWRIPYVLQIMPPSFDIKREATAPLDAAIRLLALHGKIKETNTLERLQKILEEGLMPKAMADSVHVAFDYVLRLRFKLEFSMDTVVNTLDHTVNPQDLVHIELKELKDSLITIYKLQDYVFETIAGFKVPWSMR